MQRSRPVQRRKLTQEVPHEQRYIGPTLTQRRQRDRNDIQAVVQVFAKLTFVLHLDKRSARGGNHADIDRDFEIAAHRRDGAAFEYAEQFGLQVQREVADLVDEHVPLELTRSDPCDS